MDDLNLTDVRYAFRQVLQARGICMANGASERVCDSLQRAIDALERIEARLTEREPSPGPMGAAEMIDQDDRR